MLPLRFEFEGSLVPRENLEKIGSLLEPEIEKVNSASREMFETEYAAINLPINKEMSEVAQRAIEEQKKLNPDYLIVIGIGGSNLGTLAVQEAVLGKMHNYYNGPIIFYADTVDTDNISEILKGIEFALQKGKNICLNCVSKSGVTVETIANFQIFLDMIKRYRENYRDYIVVTTEKNSKFWKLAVDEGFAVLEIPKKISGRYSVLSPVSLFPLGMLNIDIKELLKGAEFMRDLCLQKTFKKNPAALSAAVQFFHYKNKVSISDLFIFSNDLESLGKWYRQIAGECLAKEFDKANIKRIFAGITPTVSIGSTDMHSMSQLYLAGPYDKFTTLVSVKPKESLKIPSSNKYEKLVENLSNKTLEEVMNSIFEGVSVAYARKQRPFIRIKMPDKSAFSIGQFIQFKILETIYLGYLMDINPFDQPEIDSYKNDAAMFLKKIQNS